MKIAIWGAGGHGGVVLDAVRCQGLHEPVVFLDDAEPGSPYHHSGLPICCARNDMPKLRADGVAGIVIAIGDESRRAVAAKIALENGFELCTVIHPSAVICSDVTIGSGTVVFAGAVIQTRSAIGENAIVNTCAAVDHDCLIGNGTQLAPGARLGGRVTVGGLSFIGIGATVINKISIGCNCVVGAGAVVVHDIPDNVVAYGVPARVIRKR